MNIFKDMIRRGAAILRLAANDFKAAYSGSVFGSVWAVAEPLVTVLVYWFVYSVAFGGQTVNGVPFYIWLSVGIAPWFFISNGLAGVAACYRDYAFLIKKTRLNRAELPVVRTVSSLFSHLIFSALVIVAAAVSGHSEISVLRLGTALFLTSLFIYAMGRVLALACAVFKDTKNILSVALSVGFWITPIFWSVEALPQELAGFIYINPAAVSAELYRAAILNAGNAGTELIVYLAGICAIILLLGRIIERRVLPNIADGL